MPHVRVLRLSPGYRSAPHGPPQPDYVNAVLEVDTTLEPSDLLAAGHAVERDLGRRRGGPRWSARPIDIDLLLAEDAGRGRASPDETDAPHPGRSLPDGPYADEPGGLVLPHPRIAERRFVLQPLADLAPSLVHPVAGRTVAELLAACADAPLLGGPFALPPTAGVTRLEHGGDLALRIEAASFAGLVERALHGLVDVVVPRDLLREERRRELALELPVPESRLTAAQRAELLADALTEVLVGLDADAWLPARAAVRLDDRRLRVAVFGQTLRGRDLPIEHSPKAVTRHGLRVTRRRAPRPADAGHPAGGSRWSAHLVLDL
jgi:2-amino-4-hydroxy-6-hydroxymethyldihydropteridine diphosphokinase